MEEITISLYYQLENKLAALIIHLKILILQQKLKLSIAI
jgi:hypothetical protein